MIETRMTEQVADGSRHPCFLVPRAEYDSLHSGENYCPGAHCARLQRHVERAVVEPPAIELRRRLPNREDLSVRCRILITYRAVRRGGEECALANDNGSDGNFISLPRLARESERVANVLLVQGQRAPAGGESRTYQVAICLQARARSPCGRSAHLWDLCRRRCGRLR